ncbi:hypothetical protein RIF23_00765 [Lipingzhangella sp. LS1_29]|uniref:Uncharacterized protein n=1 Tax=Lipingzhangella rawalii TaxID=2055835 RepID=A0ABU2H2G0_9ACTN|nr:hypothetical protein [Lipingzhangella rawalii]MDS1268819.1 hypothetical protein [Lipingzhangella rawalii]
MREPNRTEDTPSVDTTDAAAVDTSSASPRIDLSPSQVVGGGAATLAAATAASYAGLYGTIIGAAVMSVLSTSGTAVFQYYLRRSGDKAKELAETQRRRPAGSNAPDGQPGGGAGGGVGSGVGSDGDTTTALSHTAPSQTHASSGTDVSVPGSPKPRAAGGWRRWRGAALSAVAVFLVVMALVTAFELFSGKSLSDTVRGSDGGSAPTLLGGGSTAEEDEPDSSEGDTGEDADPAPRQHTEPNSEPEQGQGGQEPGAGSDSEGDRDAPTDTEPGGAGGDDGSDDGQSDVPDSGDRDTGQSDPGDPGEE